MAASPRQLRAVVKYTYEAEDGNQLSLRAVGDVITIHSQDSDDWWDGEFDGQRGYLPAKYVELVNYVVPAYDASGEDVWERERRASLTHNAAAADLGSSLPSHARHTSSAALYLPSHSSSLAVHSAAPLLESHSDLANGGHEYWSHREDSLGSASSLGIDSASMSGGGGGAYGAGPAFLGAGGGGAMGALGGGAAPRSNVFTLWSSSVAKVASVSAMVMGAFTLIMGVGSNDYFGVDYVYVGGYSMLLGLMTLLYEHFVGLPPAPPRSRPGGPRYHWPILLRAVIYALLLVPLLVTYPTRFPSVLYMVVAIVNLVAALRGERGGPAKSKSRAAAMVERPWEELQEQEMMEDESSSSSSSIITSHMDYVDGGGEYMSAMGSPPPRSTPSRFVMLWPRSFRAFFLERGTPFRFRRWALLLSYFFVVNLALLLFIWDQFLRPEEEDRPKEAVDGDGETSNKWWLMGRITQWFLLINIVPFIVTNMHGSARGLYDLAVGAGVASTATWVTRSARWVLTFLPPDPHNVIQFWHRLLAGVITIWAALHGLAHTLSFTVEPRDTLNTYHYSVYTTGALLVVILLLIYSIQTPQSIREGSLRLYNSVHALYIPFFLLLIFHAKSGFSYQTLLVVLPPLALWVIDAIRRYLRVHRALFPVVSVAHLSRPQSGSLRLEISTKLAPPQWQPGQYEEGAFAYACFPALSNSIWLPVTISSAPPVGGTGISADGSGVGEWSGRDREMSLTPSPSGSGPSFGSSYIAGALASSAAVSSAASTLTLHIPMTAPSAATSSVFSSDGAAAVPPPMHAFSARVADYFEGMAPLGGSSHFVLDEKRRSGHEVSQGGYAHPHSSPSHSHTAHGEGRLYDNGGHRLVLLDGPHPSPVSHVTRYHTCMVVAPSSGVCALSSVLQSVVLQRWKNQLVVGSGGIGGHMSQATLNARSKGGFQGAKGMFTTPDVLFLYWIVQHAEIDEHRWMCQMIKDVEDELYLMRESPNSELFLRQKHLELHVFVTGAPMESSAPPPASAAAGGYGRGGGEEVDFGPPLNLHGGAIAARSPFSTMDLYRALKYPSRDPVQMSDVHVHRGAPSWGDLMTAVSHRAPGQSDVGCIYTGGPLSQHLTVASAPYLHAAGLPTPAPAAIHAYQRTARSLQEQCKHQARQSGKQWVFHSEMQGV